MTLVDGISANPELTPEETQALLEQLTDKYLGIPLEEFYRLAEAGILPDHPVVPHLILLSGARASSC
jgi:hypothetical protein